MPPLKSDILVPLLLRWFAVHARDLPWRRTRDPYAIWVSEIMLQQTQVKTVIAYWERWMRELPSIGSLANAPSDTIHKLWEGLGYYTRVRNMQKAARLIVENHDGKFPRTPDDVLALPGIGRYTAGAICSIAFDLPTPVLDGNVIRVLTRVFGITGNPRDKTVNGRLWTIAGSLVNRARSDSSGSIFPCSCLNQALMELGALICSPRQPKCGMCPLSANCIARQNGNVERLPNLGPRTRFTDRRFAAFLVKRNGRYLVRRRPAGVVNALLWEFPNVELVKTADLTAAARSAIGFTPTELQPECTIKHSITRYRITLDAFTIRETPPPDVKVEGSWIELSRLHELSFPSAHRKIIQKLLPGHT